MTLYERSVRRLCQVAFAGDDELQREVRSVAFRAADDGRRSQLRELGGLTALSLRQAGTRATSDHRGWARSAAYLAAPAAFYVTAASLATTIDSADKLGWIGVALLAAAGVSSAVGSRLLTMLIAAAALLPVASSTGPAIIVAIAISLATSMAIPRESSTAGRRQLGSFYLAVGSLVALAVLAGLPVLDVGAVRITTIVVASVLVLLGWFDPRYALVAAVVFACRFATFDLVGLGEALESLSTGLVVDELVVRSFAMAAGLIASLMTARHSIVRTSAI